MERKQELAFSDEMWSLYEEEEETPILSGVELRWCRDDGSNNTVILSSTFELHKVSLLADQAKQQGKSLVLQVTIDNAK